MPTRKTLLVFALEPHAATRFEALVLALGGCDVSRVDTAPPEQSDHQALRQTIIIVTHHWPAWVNRLQSNADRYDAIYLRPAAVLMLDLFNQVLPGAGDALEYRRREVLFLDGLLSRYHALSVEDLFLEDTRASERIARLLTDLTGSPVSATSSPVSDHGATYDASVAALLVPARGEGALAEDSHAVFELDAVHRVADGAAGSLVLEAGWSRPESSHVWSEGNVASLRFPVPPIGGPFRCQLKGSVVQSDFVVRVSIEGNLVGTFDKPHQQPRDIVIDVPLTLTREHGTGPIRMTLEFDGTVCPWELGLSGDRRRLGLALMSFRIYAVRSKGAHESRAAVALQSLRTAGYQPLVAGPQQHTGSDVVAPAHMPTSTFYPAIRPGICVLVVPPAYENLRDPIRFCAAARCELLLLVRDAALSSGIVPVQANDPQVVPFTRTLEQAFEALTRLQLQPDTIVLWHATPDDAALATLSARLRGPAGMPSDLVLKTDDFRSLEALQSALPGYSEVIMAVDGTVLISSRARSARRP